ncbi:hypothetical protein LshimejAT787_0905080 [Lyophyllum shimeji]|uniref:Uncharacterized protein n=1 Tax=Lyophyllum shimeji TaxID=47721 RepID=A0A9P3PSK8_LYOSH|nr:hypothetical protein LshimejAT787_0905080 [Lyophyllum shimeji]
MSAEQNSTIAQRLSIGTYLSKALLPAFKASDSKQWLSVPICAKAWPEYTDLQRQPGERCLRQVERTDTYKFVVLVQNYLQSSAANAYMVNEAMVWEEESPRLRLPSKDLVLYDDTDIEFLSRIDNEELFVTVVQDYVLRTVSEALRIIEGQPLDSRMVAALQFRKYSHLCPAHHARWDILAMRGTMSHPFPFFVFVVPPWEFGIQDFTELTSAQQFLNNELGRPSSAAHKLWAVIHDTCRRRGRFFVVTNYTRWAFGEFSPDDSAVFITAAFEAPILEFDGKDKATQALGCNVVEMLAFWTAWALSQQT